MSPEDRIRGLRASQTPIQAMVDAGMNTPGVTQGPQDATTVLRGMEAQDPSMVRMPAQRDEFGGDFDPAADRAYQDSVPKPDKSAFGRTPDQYAYDTDQALRAHQDKARRSTFAERLAREYMVKRNAEARLFDLPTERLGGVN